MATLSEINQRLVEQNKEQAVANHTLDKIRQHLQDQIDQEKNAAGKRREEEIERQQKARKARANSTSTGFRAGVVEGTGLGGMTDFAKNMITGLFGGLSGAGLMTTAGRVAGKILKGAFLGGLVLTFGETVIKSLFDKLAESGIDLGFTEEQQNSIASKATDGIFAALITGIVTKNPLVRIASGIVTAFKDEIWAGIKSIFGINVIGNDKDGYTVSFSWMDAELDVPKLSEDWMSTIVALGSALMISLTMKLKSLTSKIFSRNKFDTKLADLEKTVDQRLKEIDDNLAKQQRLMEEKMNSKKSYRRGGPTAAEIEKYQSITQARERLGQYGGRSVGADFSTVTDAQKARQGLQKYTSDQLSKAGYERISTKDGRVLYRKIGDKTFVSPTEVLDNVKKLPPSTISKVGGVIGKGAGIVGLGFIASDISSELQAIKSRQGNLTTGDVSFATQKGINTNIAAIADIPAMFSNLVNTGLNYGLGTEFRTDYGTDVAGAVARMMDRRRQFEKEIGYTGFGLGDINANGLGDALIATGKVADQIGENIASAFTDSKPSPYASMTQQDFLSMAENLTVTPQPGYQSAPVVINQDNSVNTSSQSSAGMHLGGTGMSAIDLRYERKYSMIKGFGSTLGQVF